MNEFSRYYVELFRQIWEDIVYFFRNVVWNEVLVRLYNNFKSYFVLLKDESVDFTVVSYVMVAVSFILNIALIIFLIAKLFIWFNKYASFRSVEIEKNELIEEIALLNDKVVSLMDEKNQIMALKVSQLGINASTGEPSEKIILVRFKEVRDCNLPMKWAELWLVVEDHRLEIGLNQGNLGILLNLMCLPDHPDSLNLSKSTRIMPAKIHIFIWKNQIIFHSPKLLIVL